MDWAKQFYEQQNNLLNIYRTDVQDYHHDKVKLIQKSGISGGSVLELGAGGGQMAVATAQAGYRVTAIELIHALSTHITELAQQHNQSVTVLNADFYQVKLDQQFDVITYWDGFGIGTDDDQLRLLKRCASWLKPNGIMLLDVYTPWYWANAQGQEMQFGNVCRRYEFDALGCRMLDTWWHADSPDDRVTQSLRCYSTADLKLLLPNTGLSFVDVVKTGGAVNTDGQYEDHVDLYRAMSYTLRLAKSY